MVDRCLERGEVEHTVMVDRYLERVEGKHTVMLDRCLERGEVEHTVILLRHGESLWNRDNRSPAGRVGRSDEGMVVVVMVMVVVVAIGQNKLKTVETSKKKLN